VAIESEAQDRGTVQQEKKVIREVRADETIEVLVVTGEEVGSEKDGDRIIKMAGGRDMRIVRIEAVETGEGTRAATEEVGLAVGGIRVMIMTGNRAGTGAGAEIVAAT
jgi:hypothetical protein